MKIVVAMDSFKGSLRAQAACEAAREGILAEIPAAEVVLKPLADGGEGTADAVIAAAGGAWVPVEVTGPIPAMRVRAGFAWLPDAGPSALVEMASASGLELLTPDQLNPLATTTVGTGELLRAAVDRGARSLWLAIGGSATVDGGVGAAMALGWRFLAADGDSVGLGGGELERIAGIRPPEGGGTALPPVRVLCDVDNPLLGDRGAAHVFGPQKGAGPDMVDRLERGLANLAERIERDLDIDVRGIPGAGAAGGLGAGAVAFMSARLISGVDSVMQVVGLEEALRGADVVITGEGSFDEQSFQGKVVSGVQRLAARARVPVAVIAGTSRLGIDEARRRGVSALEVSTPDSLPLDEGMSRAAELVTDAARRLAVSLGQDL